MPSRSTKKCTGYVGEVSLLCFWMILGPKQTYRPAVAFCKVKFAPAPAQTLSYKMEKEFCLPCWCGASLGFVCVCVLFCVYLSLCVCFVFVYSYEYSVVFVCVCDSRVVVVLTGTKEG